MIGENIKKYREKTNLSVKELSELIKCSEGTIKRYERGDRTPTLEYLQLISKVLNVDINCLASKEELKNITIRIGFNYELKETLSNNIIKFRTRKGITQRQLSEKTNISIIALNRYEKGTIIPNLEAIIKIADVLNVSIDELVGRNETKKESNNYKIYCKLPERIKMLRVEKGLSQGELSKLLNVKPATMRIWEESFVNVTDRLIDIAKFYNVSFDYLFGRTDEKGIFKEPTESINERLKILCSKMPYAELGRKLIKYNVAVSHAGINRWFKDSIPSTNIIMVLSDIFNVSIDYLMGV